MPRRVPEHLLRRLLCILFHMTRGVSQLRTKRHPPAHAVIRRFPRHERGDAWRALRELERMKLIEWKAGTESIQLTREGWRVAMEWCIEE